MTFQQSEHDLLIRLDEKVDNLVKGMNQIQEMISEYPVFRDRIEMHTKGHNVNVKMLLVLTTTIATVIASLLRVFVP